MPMAALSEGESAACQAQGHNILVVCIDGGYFAVDAVCSHAGQSLETGRIRGGEIICPLHGGRFDLRTGACTKQPASEALRTYPVLIEGGKVCVDLS